MLAMVDDETNASAIVGAGSRNGKIIGRFLA
jgi:hypothetical protein